MPDHATHSWLLPSLLLLLLQLWLYTTSLKEIPAASVCCSYVKSKASGLRLPARSTAA
jgi:hypothetical protein